MNRTTELGVFWFPNDESNEFPGMVGYDDDGAIILTTHERLENPQDSDLDSDLRGARVICGRVGSQYIKLVRCQEVDQRVTLLSRVGHFRESTWSCRFGFRGDYYDGERPERIKSAQLCVHLLGEWVPALTRFEFKDEGETSLIAWPTDGLEHTARWSLGDLALRQNIGVDWGSSRRNGDSIAVATDTTLRLAFDSPQPFASVLDAATSLQVLLTVFKGAAAGVDSVSVIQAGDPDATVSVHYVPNLRHVGRTVRYSELLTFDEFGGIDGIALWFDILREQTVLQQALVIDRFHQPAFTTDRTGHLLAACEVYMRRKWNKSSERIWNFGQQVLEPMVEQVGEAFKQWVGDAQTWTGRVAHIRNYWGVAHFQGYGLEPEDEYGIYPINQELYTLLILCVLGDCGLSDQLLAKVVDRMGSPYRVTV